ncbi:TIM-barrel domain-containing protein [Deinococcus yavapaiensis]|uniref:Alpha-glucosidase (Family GH31 glycosyl hydrolase) n=1 Tax=Deinococcus yavapaiensis KR-236 TaxID=694435 RepID=A0A318S2M4_9DEIO|nr:TIM-barrel domain-containing protein [Deinococcus yavapaiensis]PYE52702.1 alpha-glucosidase (family GH31 glycosyl hydrolase) [Deinococcus yavapaiensis KR-236]
MNDTLTASLSHRPFGIDDPYKKLPDERSPRDPAPGDRVTVNFRATTEKASVTLTSRGRREHLSATSLGDGLFTTDLGVVTPGEYTYTIEAGGASQSFSFTVGAWREVRSVEDVRVEATLVHLTLGLDDGSTLPCILSFPASGVCAVGFGKAAGTGLELRAHRADGRLAVRADGALLELDCSTLDVTVSRPGGTAVARGSLKFRVLVGSDLARLEARFHAGDELYGLGERFTPQNRRGKLYDVRVYEEYKEQGDRTYLPAPFVVSPDAWGVWLAEAEPSFFDLRRDEAVVTVEKLPSSPLSMSLHFIVADEPYGVTSAFVELNGGLSVPPKWAFGPWMSSNDWNNQARTLEVVRRTVQEDIPATVLVLEAWSDESTFYIFNDAAYTPKPGSDAFALSDFTFGERWPDPKGMIAECHSHGVHVLLWQIPVQKHVPEDHPQHHADEAHMSARGLGVRDADGTPYRCKGWWFTDGLVVDFTNPEAREWWFAKRAYLFDDLGIDGMKTDGGEHLWGRDLRTFDGRRGQELFNAYANDYVGAYHDFVSSKTRGNGLTFSRAGFTGAGKYPAHWAGDENSTWSALKASVQAGVSAGISGVSMWTWDIGGFSGDIPSVELYLRSVAFGALCPIMQYHSEFNAAKDNRDRTPWNIAERHGDPRALSVYRFYAKLRMSLLDYVDAEAREMSAVGLPLMRSPELVYPRARAFLHDDPHAYLFGRDLLVCPVVEKGALAREVRLPPGRWTDVWSGAEFEGERVVLVPAPLERIPVFVRTDSERASVLVEIFRGARG